LTGLLKSAISSSWMTRKETSSILE
jgi:hypothetical protein